MQGLENMKLSSYYTSTNIQTSTITMQVLFSFERWDLPTKLHAVLTQKTII
jgi:hypothetical protein